MITAENFTISGGEILTSLEFERVKHAIINVYDISKGPHQIDPLIGNISPFFKVFKLTSYTNESVVQILDLEHHAKESLSEIDLIRNLSKHNIIPPLYYLDECTGIIIIKFLGEIYNFSTNFQNKNSLSLAKVAKKIRLFHSLPLQNKPSGLLPSNLQIEQLEKVYKVAASYDAYQIYLQGLEYLNELGTFVDQSTFCHNNLHCKNVLYNGEEIYIIDWENAGAGDPFLDLASFLCLARFSTEQEIEYLTAYLGTKPTKIEIARFNIMKQISYLKYAIELFATIDISQLNPDVVHFDQISIFSDSLIKISVNSIQDKFVFIVALLKETFAAIQSQELLEAIQLVSESRLLPKMLLKSRFFACGNPKYIERAKLAAYNCLSDNGELKIEFLSGDSEIATNYKAIFDDAPRIAIRVYHENTTPEQFQHKVRLYQHAASIELGPIVKFIDKTNYCLVTTFINTSVVSWQRNLSNEHLLKLSEKLKILHNTTFPIITPNQTCTGLPIFYLELAQKLAKNPQFRSLNEIIVVYQRLLSIIKPEVLSHNSLSGDNIFFNGENFQIIDWENASMNDRLYDPAFIACYFFLTPEQEKVLLKNYLGRRSLTRAEDQKYYLMKLLVLTHLAIVTITKCKDFEFITKLPKLDEDQRYFNHKEKVRNLLNLQSDFGKYTLHQILCNEIRFSIKTGKFLDCEKSLLSKDKTVLTFEDLPSSTKLLIFSNLSRNEFARVSTVNKKWARAFYSLRDNSFPIPNGFDTVKETDRDRIISALKATFTPYKICGHEKIDQFLSPTTIISITQILSGTSPWSNNYKLVVNDDTYVVRLFSTEQDITYTKQEILIMKFFSSIEVSPKIQYISNNCDVVIMDFIEAIPAWYMEKNKENLDNLGLILNQMNKVSLEKPTNSVLFHNKRLKDIYFRVYKLCREEYLFDSRFQIFREVLVELDQLKYLCESITEYTICHHDFHVWNVLKKK